MLYIISILLSLALATENSTYVKTSYAGIVTTAKKEFMDKFKDVILDQFLNNLKTVKL